MKQAVLKFVKSDAFIACVVFSMVVAVFATFGGCDRNHVMAMAAVATVAGGGKYVSGAPLTLSATENLSPELLRNEIDDRIVRIRPMATPIDQISRQAGARMSGSMIVDYYSVDTKPTEATLKEIYISDDSDDSARGFVIAKLKTSCNELFEPSETIMAPDVKVVGDDGESEESLVMYVIGRDSEYVRAISVNAKNDRGLYAVPDMEVGTKLIRMGRAAGELDVQTAQFEALPIKSRNYCQIFKAQVEQSTYQKIANKEVGWTFSDQEEAAIIDMRLGMEKNFLFGVKNRIYDPDKGNEVMLTGGIWQQAGRQFNYTVGSMSENTLIELTRKAFTGNGGSSKKLLIGGTMLIEQLNKLDHVKVVGATETMTRWGLDFTEIITKFGKLYVLASEVFDQCGHANDGMILDPEYMTKYCHVAFRTERLDLRKSGIRNTDAIVITEASCLVLRYPDAHLRVVGQ
jgi:hypothetical protein